MPWMVVRTDNEWCVHKENEDGSAGEKVACHPSEAAARLQLRALYANVEEAAAKYFQMVAVKAVGDWEVEIRAVPYGYDSDGQVFDSETDYMETIFNNPAILYHHGVKPGIQKKYGMAYREIEDKPVVIGTAKSVEKRADGVYIMAILDKTKEFAKRVWDAARKGMAFASSDSITHLARMSIGGKTIMYDKQRPGRITVWPLAGVSLWDANEENMRPSSQRAIALPAMKAIYREAGIPFPDIENDTTGVSEAQEEARKRAEIARHKALEQIEKRSKK